MSKSLNKPAAGTVGIRRSIRRNYDHVVLEILETMHAALLKLEVRSLDSEISELNNAVRSALDVAWGLSREFLQEAK